MRLLNHTIMNNIINNSKKIITGSDIIYNFLYNKKIKDVFIYSGGSIMPLIDKLYNSPINYYVNTNELNTGLSAVGYSKSSNRTGICMVTSGPGLTNILTPILDATNDSTPLIVFSGQVGKAAMGTNAFQEAPSVELTKPITKWSYCVKNVNELPSVLENAFFIANDKKKGAVHIDLPKCVLNDTYSFYTKVYIEENKKQEINIEQIKTVSDIINNSKKPILYIGQGCMDAYKLLREYAIKSNIPVTTTIHGCGIFDEHHPLSMRWCGMHGSAFSNYAIQESDCIIGIGSRFDDRTTGLVSKYAPNAENIIHVNIEESEIKKVVDSNYNFHCSSKEFLQNILPFTKYNPRTDWIQYCNDLKQKYPFKYTYKRENIRMEYALKEIYKQTLDKDVLFTTGVGNHQMQAYQFILSEKPKKILSSGSLGVMGAGLPYAIGSQIANPHKLIINLDGDSSFNMTLNDLKTIKEYNLPIKIIVFNNSTQMMVNIWEKLFFNERYTATINNNNPDYCKLANSFGIKSIFCENEIEIGEKIKELIEYNGPMLLELNIDKNICLPLVGPGKALDDMILFDEYHKNNKIELNGLAPS